MFIDEATISIASGKGGNGCVSFRREKYIAAGGPDGGDGGRGGHVYLVARSDENTLADFRIHRHYKAQNGGDGSSSKCTGKDGEDLYIHVPVGTLVREAESDLVVVDMVEEGQTELILRGGKGGKGNVHFATPTMQIPRYAQPGQEGKNLELKLELKVLADVGLVGFPNAGKSTFLSHISNARPKIANYPFTTLSPQLGVVNLPYGKTLIVADIPGLIEGAADGLGLGHEFLRHLERTRVLIHLVDAAGTDGRDPLEDIETINRELLRYSPQIAALPRVLAFNKTDLPDSELFMEELTDYAKEASIPAFPISAYTGDGLRPLLDEVVRLRETQPKEVKRMLPEYTPESEEEKESILVEKTAPHFFSVSGPAVDRMLGYTNLGSEKGFDFFQRFFRDRGILERLQALGVEEGDTIDVSGLQFDYFE